MITASCHCGAVTIEMARKPRKMTACNCSICRRYGAIWAYFQRKTVRVIAEQSCLTAYTWRNGVRQYMHCRLCGCVTHYERAEKRADGSDTLAVNMRNIDHPSLIASLPIKLLDGASSWDVLDETPRPEIFGPLKP